MKWLWQHGGKRLFDVGLALGGGLIFALPAFWIALQIWKRSGWPILFRQCRIGREGRPFFIWKFRSMGKGEEVTPFGALLRSSAMDELPQLVNILKGEMSFVGPRPLIPEELRELDEIPGGSRRLSIQPGLAGLAQLFSLKIPSIQERLKWDLLYLERCSPGLDLKILLQSIGVSLHRRWESPGPKVPLKGCSLHAVA